MSATAKPAAWPGEQAFTWPSTATQTALKVLDWTARPGGSAPRGSLGATADLAGSAAAATALRRLTRATAARLGAGQPIFGDPGPIGLGGIFLAAAIGGRIQAKNARRLAALIEPPALGRTAAAGWADALARHAVAGPALAPGALDATPPSHCDAARLAPAPDGPAEHEEPMTQVLLRASPLSAILLRPADGQSERAMDIAFGLVRRPHGGDMLACALSAWQPDAGVLSWRSQLLSRIAASDPAFVADVYTAARLHGGWDQRLSWAGRQLASAPATQPPDEVAVATIDYWSALGTRRVQAKLRASRVLAGFDDILTLIRMYGLKERVS